VDKIKAVWLYCPTRSGLSRFLAHNFATLNAIPIPPQKWGGNAMSGTLTSRQREANE
jgi:hypothetical protein